MVEICFKVVDFLSYFRPFVHIRHDICNILLSYDFQILCCSYVIMIYAESVLSEGYL